MLAWGLNVHHSSDRGEDAEPEHALNALLLESTLMLDRRNTLFGRAEGLEVDELFDDPDPRSGEKFRVGKLSLGYLFAAPHRSREPRRRRSRQRPHSSRFAPARCLRRRAAFGHVLRPGDGRFERELDGCVRLYVVRHRKRYEETGVTQK